MRKEKNSEKGLASIEDCIDSLIQEFEDCIKKSKERLIKAATGSIDNISTDKKTTKTWKQKWEEKPLYRYFKRQTGAIAQEKTWA